MKKYSWVLTPALCLLLGLSTHEGAFAGTTGKITGQVIDAATKGPLPGVNVTIQGTRKGATTDVDGYYLILSVDPGTYTLVASIIGYSAVSKTDARVRADFTTTVDFQLKQRALELEEVVVTAEQPPVEPDKTTSHYVMSSEQIASLPMARSINDLVALNPGVNLTNTTSIRGGDSQDGAFYVDGIRLQNNDGYGRPFTGINKTAIQELVVISGGANAEYGNLESGAISVVTKDGGREFRGWVDFRYTPPGKKHWGSNIYESPYHKDKLKWGDATWRTETTVLGPGLDALESTPDDRTGLAHRRIDYTDVKGHLIEGGLSGPIGSKVSFFASARWTRQPQDVTSTSSVRAITDPSNASSSLPSVRSAGFPSLRTPFDFRGNLKLTFRPTPDVKLSVGEIYAVAEGFNAGTNVLRDLAANGQNVFLPDGSGAGRFRITDNVTYLNLTHTISPRTFYEVKLAYYSTKEDTQSILNPRDRFGFPVPIFAKKDLDGWFNVRPAQLVNFVIADRSRLNLRADFSSQVTKGHFLKTGAEVTRYNLYYLNYVSDSPSRRTVAYITAPGHLPDDKAPIKPIQMALYVQDKMEFEGMVLNAGVRFDAFYTNTRFYNVSMLQSPQYRWLNKHYTMPTVSPEWATQISPRFGVSHPITSRSAFHFTAGLYTNLPDLLQYFRESWLANGPDEFEAWDRFRGIQGQTDFSNPYVQYMKTRAYEAGADWNFVAEYTAGVTAYYKSAISKIGRVSRYWYEPAVRPTWVWGAKPNQQQDLKGVEVNFRKGFSHHFSFNAAINFGWASWAQLGPHGSMFYPDSSYIADPNKYWDWQWDASQKQYVRNNFTPQERAKWGNTVENWWRSREQYARNQEFIDVNFQDVVKAYQALPGFRGAFWETYGGGRLYNPKNEDQRTQASLSLYFSSPAGFGPGVRGFHPVGDLRANLIWRIQSGGPIFYTPPGRQQELRHRPIREWTDLQVEKTLVSKGPRDVIFYVEVFNLFNQWDSAIPFAYPDYARWGLNLPRPDDKDYQTYGDYNELTRYVGRPREVGVGLRVNF